MCMYSAVLQYQKYVYRRTSLGSGEEAYKISGMGGRDKMLSYLY